MSTRFPALHRHHSRALLPVLFRAKPQLVILLRARKRNMCVAPLILLHASKILWCSQRLHVCNCLGAYWKSVALKYGVPRYTKLSHQVVGSRYDEKAGMWDLEIKNLGTDEVFADRANAVIQAVGRCHAKLSGHRG